MPLTSSSPESRREPRTRGFARAVFEGAGMFGHVIDTSPRGLCVCLQENDDPGEVKDGTVGISFEEEGISAFTLRFLVRWRRTTHGQAYVGLELEESQCIDSIAGFRKLVEIYKEIDGNVGDIVTVD